MGRPKVLTPEEAREHRRLIQRRWNSKESSKERKRLYYQTHKLEHKRANDLYKARVKIEVLSHYSNESVPICSRCSIVDIDVLTIDHIQGKGHEHKKLTQGHLYRWLQQNNYPEGFQVLCFNCNFKKWLEGIRGYTRTDNQ